MANGMFQKLFMVLCYGIQSFPPMVSQVFGVLGPMGVAYKQVF